MDIKQQHEEAEGTYLIKTVRAEAGHENDQDSIQDNRDCSKDVPQGQDDSVKQQPNNPQNDHSLTPDLVQNVQSAQPNPKIKKRPRKIRTTITKQKLIQMNTIFNEYMQDKERGSIPTNNLKQIGRQLKLGYSTILHKYREFRAFHKVKGGALISSLQKRRKYKKSLMIEQILQQTLNERPFYTAVELSQYIFQKYGLEFSRSIISRHLGEMGYSYKNLRHSPEQKTQMKYKQIRKIYSEIVIPLLQRNQKLIYIDQLTCSVGKEEDERYVSVVVILTIYGIVFYNLQEGFFTRVVFMNMLKEFLNNLRESENCRNLQGKKQELYLVMDMNRIHRDNQANLPGIANLMLEANAELLYIPPCSPQLNPLESMFERLKEKLSGSAIETFDDLWNKLETSLQDLKQQSIEPYFREVNKWLTKCHNQQAF